MTVVPAQAVRGSPVSVSGSGLPARQSARLFLGLSRVARFRVNRRGDWELRVRIPAAAPARRSLMRVVVAGRRALSVRFPVTKTAVAGSAATSLAVLSTGEQLRLSPTRARAGSSLTLIGAGFRHHAALGVFLGSTRAATLRSSASGALRAHVRIPLATRPRAQSLSVRFGRRHLRLRLIVARPAKRKAPPPAPPAPTPAPPPPPDPVVDAVGDMACSASDPNYNAGNGVPTAVPPADNCLQKSVSDLILNPLPTALLDLGDNQYDNGELGNYQTVYDPTFGRANSVVYPSLGNAEYGTTNAAGFFGYFGLSTSVFSRIQTDGGDNSHLTTGGYYSFNLGAWHIIALNSNCAEVTGGCAAGSPEERWLKSELAAHPSACTLAYWHHPRWNSGTLGDDRSSAAFWTDLYAAHAEVVLNGHANHHYERFLPQSPDGAPDPAGIREFIVSTGGQSHGTPPATPEDPNTSQITNYTTYGILRLTLHPSGFDWDYVPAAGGTFTDSGTGTCH
jgi:hypothetical protein